MAQGVSSTSALDKHVKIPQAEVYAIKSRAVGNTDWTLKLKYLFIIR
jgi:hypothetical protein